MKLNEDEIEMILTKRAEKVSNKNSEKRDLTNLSVMDYMVFICLISIIVFTSVSLYQYYANGIPVSDMKTEVFTFFGAELLGMAAISISNNVSKNKKKNKNNEEAD